MASQSSSGQSSGSVQAIVTSLIFNGVIFLVLIFAFLLLRPRHRRVYEKRITTSTEPASQKPRPPARGYFAWFGDLMMRRDSEIVRDTGLDGYFFLRFLRLLASIAIIGMIILMPILLPVNATNGKNDQGFDLLAFGNITNKNRYFAHVFLSWIFFGIILYMIYRELLFYTAARQACLTSDAYRTRLSSRTVMVNSVPKQYQNEAYFRSIFAGVKRVYFSHDAKKLSKLVKKRDKLLNRVEGAENKMLNTGVKNRLKAEKKGQANGQELSDYIKKAPTFRLKPLIGKKVNTLDYAKEHVAPLNEEIEEKQTNRDQFKKLEAVFVTFYTQTQAEVAVQMLAFNRPLQFAPRYIGIRPDEIIWPNLALTWYGRLGKALLAATFCTLLVIFWTIPVAFVGFVSQIDTMTKISGFQWLSFVNNLPGVLHGLISSLLPIVLLAIVMMLPPILIRKAAKIAGSPSLTYVEYYTQQYFFAFQVIQAFLMVTFTSSIMAALPQLIAKPAMVLTYFQTDLPRASNFFMSYLLLQALSVPAMALIQIVAVLLFIILGKFLDNTARKKWNRANIVGGIGWGTVFPIYTNMAVIMFTYSIIAPLILPFGAALFMLCYVAYLNNLTFCVQKTNGRGIYYARALQHLFIGLYLAEFCLVALFVFAKAWGPVVLEVAFFLFTIWVQGKYRNAFGPMLFTLPRSLLGNTGSSSNAKYGDDGSSNATAMHPGQGDSYKQNSNGFVGGYGQDPRYQQGYSDERQHVVAPVGYTASGGYDTHGYGGRDSVDTHVAPGTQASTTLAGSARDNNKYHGADAAALVDSERNDNTEEAPKGGVLEHFFKPWRYYTPALLRERLLSDGIWQDEPLHLPEHEEEVAYLNPAYQPRNPVVWFPADPYGWADAQRVDLREAGINAQTTGAWYQINEEKKKADVEFSNNVKEIPVFEPDQGL